MRHRWIRSTCLGTALLTAAVLAVLSAPAATAQTVMEGKLAQRSFWDQKEHWADQTMRKALRATQQAKRWEVLVDLERDGEWNSQGFLEEVYRRRLEPSVKLDETLKSTLASLGTDILIAEVRSSKDSRFYVVAAVFEQDPRLQDSEGGALKSFLPLYRNESYQGALRFAQTYEGSFGTGELLDSPDGILAPPEDSEKVVSCETRCLNQQRASNAYCNSSYSACLSAADSFYFSCNIGCLGNAGCQAVCVSLWIFQRGGCGMSLGDCQLSAQGAYDVCIAGCYWGGGGGGCAIAHQTVTTALALDGPADVNQKLAPASLNFALARSETRGEESFVMDEWAVVQDGLIGASSNPAFGQAVTDQRPVPARGSFLMIQEPVHPMNSRHVPKPEVKISSTRLAPSERGAGEIVAARIELSPTRTVERVDIVYTSKPMEESRLKELVSQRVGLVFATEKGHRTAVYMTFRLTDRLELLDTVTVFPKCCCGGMHCV